MEEKSIVKFSKDGKKVRRNSRKFQESSTLVKKKRSHGEYTHFIVYE